MNTYSSHASGIDLGSENTQMNQTNNFLVPPRLQRPQPYRQTESKMEMSSFIKFYAESKVWRRWLGVGGTLRGRL